MIYIIYILYIYILSEVWNTKVKEATPVRKTFKNYEKYQLYWRKRNSLEKKKKRLLTYFWVLNNVSTVKRSFKINLGKGLMKLKLAE